MITKRFLTKPWLSILGVFLPVGMLCALATGAARSSMQAAVITLDAVTHYQTITGWEATTFAGQDNAAFPNFKDELFDQAINDLGINRVRLEVRSGVENTIDYYDQYRTGAIDYATWRAHRYATVNDNSNPNAIYAGGFHFTELDERIEDTVLPLRQLAQARGEPLWINLCYVAFTGQIGQGLLYIHDDPDEYAEFVLATFQHLQSKYGFAPDTWEILLEPDNVSQWSGALIGQAIAAADARLKAAGFSPRFVAPSTTNMGNAVSYFDAMIQTPGVIPALEELSYHRYSGVSDANLQAIAQRAVQHGVNTAQLEHIGSTYQDLHKDLTMGRNSAWSLFVLAAPGDNDPDGAYYRVDVTDPNNPVVELSSRGKFMRQYFKFVRGGAVRIGASSSDGAFEPAAFTNGNGTTVVVVKAASGGDVTIQGLPAGTYGVRYTTNAVFDASLPDQTVEAGGALNASIPAAGVMTVYGYAALPGNEHAYLPMMVFGMRP
jgi:hypothetical protein